MLMITISIKNNHKIKIFVLNVIMLFEMKNLKKVTNNIKKKLLNLRQKTEKKSIAK